MGNQQQNCNLKFTGKTIKSEYYIDILNEYVSGKSLMQLSNKYNYNIATIRYFLLRNDIPVKNVKDSVKKFHKQSTLILDNFFMQNFIGWILGDGGLRICKRSTNPYFTYTDLKRDHIDYVSSILYKYNIKHYIGQHQQSSCYYIQSESRPEFHEIYNLFYGYEGLNENNQKRKILPDIILTPIILRNWYIGDGCSSKQSNSFNHKGAIVCKYKNDFILKQLNDLFNNVKCYCGKSGCYQYHFNNKNLIKLLDYIGECPIEGYKYKWITRCSTTIIETSNKMDEGIV